ncbi:MAG: CoA-binding protein [Halobacteriota archaeon]|nr:CoA-binding protein [Halobacteriota archaeon]
MNGVIRLDQKDHFLDSFLNPESIAIVGATKNPIKMNFQITENLHRLNFSGKIYPVNPTSKEILGMKTYSSIREISDDIDLVISAVPSSLTLGVVNECVDVGIKRMVIVAGGFSDGDAEGEKLHNEIARITKENNIRVLGPNTLSPINPSKNLVISFHPVDELRTGGLSFVFQSGLYEYKLNWIFSHLGVSKIIDLGNKMDINEVDALEYLSNDPETKAIAMHVESVRGDGRRFMQLLQSTSKKKPIIVLKSGRTAAGSKAAASHTGSIAHENDVLFDCVLKQAGVIRAHNLDEFFDYAKTFSYLNLPRGNRIAVINLSGGEGVIATDSCEQNGFQLAKLKDETHEKVKGVFPPWEVPLNPLDIGVCAQFHFSDFNKILNSFISVIEDENVDCMLMQFFPTSSFEKMMPASPKSSRSANSMIMDLFAGIFVKMKEKGKPLALWRSSMEIAESEFVKNLELKGIPVFSSSEKGANALAALYRYKVMREERE